LGKVKLSEVKSVLSAAKKARSQNSKLLMPHRVGLSPKAANESAKLLKKAGLDVTKLPKIQHKSPRVDSKPIPNLTKEYLWRKNSIIQNAKNRISALQVPPTSDSKLNPLFGPPNQQIIQIQPFFIWVTPVGILKSSNVGEPNDNWAKIRIDSTSDSANYEVNFLYLWENPSDLQATVDVQTHLGFFGYCSVSCGSGILYGISHSQSQIAAQLNIYAWWEQDPTFGPSVLSSNSWPVEDLLVEGPGLFRPPPSKWEYVQSLPNLTYNKLAVPPGDTAVFEVNATFTVSQDNGEAIFDFNQYGWEIYNPFLTLDIYYPQISVNG
jgi:hypothetical protein